MLNKLSSYLDMYTGSKSYQVFCARKSTSIYELQQKKTGEQIAALVSLCTKKASRAFDGLPRPRVR